MMQLISNKFRAVIKGNNPQYLLRVSALGFPLILWVILPVVDRIHQQSDKFATGVEKATGDSKLNDNPV